MHRYEVYTVCDGCGKELGSEDHHSIFAPRKFVFTVFPSDFLMIKYDFCSECYAKAKKALDDICKKSAKEKEGWHNGD